jgi:hypothetical protein
LRLDYGALTLDDELNVIETMTGAVLGRLRTQPRHRLDRAHIAYHRSLFAEQRSAE